MPSPFGDPFTTDPFAQPDPTPDPFTRAAEQPTAPEPEKPKEKTPAELVQDMTAEEFAALLQLRVLQKIVNNAIADFDGTRKAYLDEILPIASKKFGTDKWTVRVPTLDDEDVHIGTVSVKRTKEKVEIAGEAALIEWAEEHYPDAVEEEHIPEKVIPAKTVKHFRMSRLDDLIAKHDAKVTPDGTYVTADGEPIPGLRHIKKDQYNGHMLSFGGNGSPLEETGRDLLLRGRIKGRTVSDVITTAAIEKGKTQ